MPALATALVPTILVADMVDKSMTDASTLPNTLRCCVGACRNPSALLWSHPTLLVFHGLLGLSAEAAFVALCIAGSALGFAAACGAAHPLVFTALWLLYLSVASVGQAFLPQPG